MIDDSDNIQTKEEIKKFMTDLDFFENKTKLEAHEAIKEFESVNEEFLSLLNKLNFSQKNKDIINHLNSYRTDDRISDKMECIRKMSIVEENVKTAIKFIDDIIDLKIFSQNIEKYIENNQLEEAANLVYRCQKIDQNFFTRLNEDSKTQLELQTSFDKLNILKIRLQRILQDECKLALNQKNISSIEKHFKMLAMAGSKSVGLELFSQFITNKIKTCFEEQSSLTIADSNESSQVMRVGLLFQTIASNIVEYSPIIDTYYGPADVIFVTREVQSILFPILKSIVKEFFDFNEIYLKLQKCKDILNELSEKISILYKISILNYETLLIFCLSLLINFETYRRYLGKILARSLENLVFDKHISKNKNSKNEFDNENILELRDEILDIYNDFEVFYMKVSCFKAFRICSINFDNFTSTVVDDVFFVMKKCLQRSAQTLTETVVSPILNNIFRFLIDEYLKYIAKNMKKTNLVKAIHETFQNFEVLTSHQTCQKFTFLFISANDLHISIENATKFLNFIKNETEANNISLEYIKYYKNNQRFMKLCAEFQQKIYHILISEGFGQIFHEHFLKMREESFVIDDKNINYFESENLVGLIKSIEQTLYLTKKIMFEKNFEEFIGNLAHDFSNIFEKEIIYINFNINGANLLHQHVREIIKIFSDSSKYFVKQHFKKLIRMMDLISVHDPNINSLQKIIFSSDTNFTRHEALHFVSLRIDIPRQVILEIQHLI